MTTILYRNQINELQRRGFFQIFKLESIGQSDITYHIHYHLELLPQNSKLTNRFTKNRTSLIIQ